jgi:hypothetical protein
MIAPRARVGRHPSTARKNPAQRTHRDDGNAIVEFLGIALLLLVPTVYLVLVLGRLQSAAFGVEGAAREAVRAAVASASHNTSPETAARSATDIALADQGLRSPDALTLLCDPSCTQPQAQITAHVAVDVELPLMPPFVSKYVPLHVPVTATATGQVDTFVAGR